MARARYWMREVKYWAGRWVACRIDSAMKKQLERLNRE